MDRRPAVIRIFCGFALLSALLLLGSAGAAPAPGQDKPPAMAKTGPVLEVKIQEKAAPSPPPASSLRLDPFFLIQEEPTRVRVLRVQVALEFGQPEILPKLDPQAPALRELVYDFLVAKEQADLGRDPKGQEKVLAALVNRYLGQEAVSAVKVDQSFLLLR